MKYYAESYASALYDIKENFEKNLSSRIYWKIMICILGIVNQLFDGGGAIFFERNVPKASETD